MDNLESKSSKDNKEDSKLKKMSFSDLSPKSKDQINGFESRYIPDESKEDYWTFAKWIGGLGILLISNQDVRGLGYLLIPGPAIIALTNIYHDNLKPRVRKLLGNYRPKETHK